MPLEHAHLFAEECAQRQRRIDSIYGEGRVRLCGYGPGRRAGHVYRDRLGNWYSSFLSKKSITDYIQTYQGYVRFLCENSVDHWKGDSLASLGTNDTNPDNHKRFAIPIRVLNANPPKKYDPSPIVIAEPTILYSVLWPNLFRTIYAAYAAWYSLLEYKIFFNDHHRVLLVDRTHGSNPYKFLQIIQSVTPTPVMTSSQLLKGPPHIFRALVVGLSRDALVAEIVLERGTEWRFTLRRRALHMFCKALKQGILNDGHFVKGLDIPGRESSDMEFASTVPSKAFWSSWIHKHKRAPRVTLVLREANMPRQILNPGELIAALSRLPIQLQVHQFRRLTLIEQVRIVDNTDIFITMHGAAMTHILFLKPGAYVIELFPYSFKKVIYENIASILGIQYLHWQNMKESQTKFNWPAVEQQRATNMTKERITKLPIDWYNMDSKNYWRNQDTVVAVEEITHLVDTVVKDRRIEGNTKYLMFMPWEQFNNQVVGFKSACAVAKILNRTLVVDTFDDLYIFQL
ncbi:hypothetical protein BDR26DRAFT_329187 [Obelidium mucronatum]|nr:hypothetical protein BDR26DRAFT_329187 [Obelidium mucronatum]